MGFFGLTMVPGKGKGARPRVEPRWRGVVDIGEACDAVADVLAVWASVSRWPDAQPFSGGVYDAWPKRLAQGIAFLKAESAAVTAYLRHIEGAAHG